MFKPIVRMEKEPLDINAAHRWNNTELTMLYRLFYKALVAYAMKITANDTAAEDIVQDVMSGVWQQQNTLTDFPLRIPTTQKTAHYKRLCPTSM